MPDDIFAPGGILRIERARKIQTGESVKVALAVFAITHAVAGPPIGKNAIRHILRHNLPMNRGHELKVIRAKRARQPVIGIGCMTPLVSVFVHCEPIRMRMVYILVARMRIGARNHVHAKLAAARSNFSKGIPVSKPLAPVMKRHLSRIEGYASARVQNRGLRVNPFEVVEPESQVVISWIILDKAQLRPAHWPVIPASIFDAGFASGARNSGGRCGLLPLESHQARRGYGRSLLKKGPSCALHRISTNAEAQVDLRRNTWPASLCNCRTASVDSALSLAGRWGKSMQARGHRSRAIAQSQK